MLVLSRKPNEQIVINDEIVVTIVEIRGDKVRLGIEAPSDVPIHRHEVYAAILRESLNTVQDSTSAGTPNSASTNSGDIP